MNSLVTINKACFNGDFKANFGNSISQGRTAMDILFWDGKQNVIEDEP